jgi:prepilin-type N-terminal cleavage/methylation domain-containing protein
MVRPGPRRRRGGFTLLEVAVTIVIVGIGLTLVLQVLNTAQASAVQTRNEKLARELGLLTLGRIASGLYIEEVQDRFYGSYAEDEHPDFQFEVALGDEVFQEQQGQEDEYERNTGYYDAFDRRRELEEEERDPGEEEVEEPYERVKVRVSWPNVADYPNTLILEQWIPWDQVYGQDEDEQAAGGGNTGAGNQP